MSEKKQVPSAGPDFITRLPQDECGDECCGEIGSGSQALRNAFTETPMQSDQIVQLAQAIRLLAFHVDMKIVRADGQCREELRGIRDSMEDLIFSIKGK